MIRGAEVGRPWASRRRQSPSMSEIRERRWCQTFFSTRTVLSERSRAVFSAVLNSGCRRGHRHADPFGWGPPCPIIALSVKPTA
jgi:hypothetical protein